MCNYYQHEARVMLPMNYTQIVQDKLLFLEILQLNVPPTSYIVFENMPSKLKNMLQIKVLFYKTSYDFIRKVLQEQYFQ